MKLEEALRKDFKAGEKKIISGSEEKNIFNKKLKIHKNVNLYVDTTRKCSANCKFCIAKVQDGLKYKDAHPEKFKQELEKCLKELKDKGVDASVSIVGGEPTVDKKLNDIVKLIDKYGMRKAGLITNASNLENYINVANKSNMEYIDISRHHYDDGLNQKFFSSKKVPNNAKLKQIIAKVKNKGKIRFNTNIIKGGIDSFDEVLKFLKYTRKMGVSNVAFAELAKFTGSKVYSKEIIDYTKKARTKIDNIVKQVEKNTDFAKVKDVKGPYYIAWIYKHKPTNVTAVFKKTYTKKMENFEKKDMNRASELIFTNKGSLEGSWVPGQKVIKQ